MLAPLAQPQIALLLLLLIGSGLALVPDAQPTPADSNPCSGQGGAYLCSVNAAQIDLSARGLSGRLTLTISNSNNSHGTNQLHLDLLNVSGNPNLTGVTLKLTGSPVASVNIARLDISGSAMAPVPGRLLSAAASLLRIQTLIANGTSYAEPLDLEKATDLLYRMRVEAFALIGWPLAKGRLPANLTSFGANRCGSKYFKSVTVSKSRPVRFLTGGSIGSDSALMAVPDTIDLSGNGLRLVSNVTFSAARIDLSDNHLADLPGVAFRAGSYCRVTVTMSPTLLLRRNHLVYAALDSLYAGSRGSGFSGLDLSGNERLVPEEEEAAHESRKSTTTIEVSRFLDLSDIGGHVSGLAALLARFRISSGDPREGAAATFRLSLADNWIPDLASAAALVTEFVAGTHKRNLSETPALVHLDLSGNRLLVHLNLSDMPPNLLASLSVKRLPRLRTASVHIRDDAGAGLLERLRSHQPDTTVLAELWSRRVPLQMDARPSRCCLTEDGELICRFDQSRQILDRHETAASGIFCYNEESQVDPQASPELPLLFTCVILGCALLLGLITGVAVFYARRRYSRGRYAVYSIYAVHVKDQHQSRGNPNNYLHQQQQLPQVYNQRVNRQQLPPIGQVQLKGITVCSSVVPIEKAATPV